MTLSGSFTHSERTLGLLKMGGVWGHDWSQKTDVDKLAGAKNNRLSLRVEPKVQRKRSFHTYSLSESET